MVDSRSLKYVEEWRQRRGDDDYATIQSRVNAAKKTLQTVLQQLETASVTADETNELLNSKATNLGERSAEVITIPLGSDDDLTDIPAEMREVVAAEIAAFRERSLKRDAQKLVRQSLTGSAKARDDSGYSRSQTISGLEKVAVGLSRSPVTNATGDLRDNNLLRADLRPSIRKELEDCMGEGVNEDEDSDAEHFVHEANHLDQTELRKLFIDNERRWMNREAGKAAAIEREKNRDDLEVEKHENERRAVGVKLAKWNDDVEAEKGFEEYYRDHSLWIRRRNIARAHESENDRNDKEHQERETSEHLYQNATAEHFKEDRQSNTNIATESSNRFGASKFKLSLGAAAQKINLSSSRKTIAEVEGLLDTEDNDPYISRRILVPIEPNKNSYSADDMEQKTAEAIRRLAAEIPTEKSELWGWNISWNHLDDAIIRDKLKPFVEKKIVEYVGVQEQLLVDVIMENVQQRCTPDHMLLILEGVSS